ncbi:hypothetical protein B0H19DRAFT_650944 [Mycena capillaripes]|nr:hypothetical protein B0H19DRAFT_650944 [Mycena capillaripes]
MDLVARSFIQSWGNSGVDDDEDTPQANTSSPLSSLAMRVLLYIRKITQPIRSLQCLMESKFMDLIATRAVDVYTISQDFHVPRLTTEDLVVRELDRLIEADRQTWSDDDGDNLGVITSSSSGSNLAGGSGSTQSRRSLDGGPQQVGSSGSSSSDGLGAGMFTAMCDSLKQSYTPVRCTASMHAECILMAAFQTAKIQQVRGPFYI